VGEGKRKFSPAGGRNGKESALTLARDGGKEKVLSLWEKI